MDMEPAPPSLRILGSTVHLIDRHTAVDRIEAWIRNHREDGHEPCRQMVVSGFQGLWESAQSPQIHRMLNDADLWVPDGIAPVAVARMRGHGPTKRVPGAELMHAFLERATARKYRSFFYGNTPETLAALKANADRDYPGHEVAGVISPPFRELTPEEDEAHIQQINAAKPDVLWVSLGLPKQERWIAERRHRLNVPVAVGVGAAFDFISGRVRRAPDWMGRMGLEWAYRLAHEPRKCWRRSLIEGPRFIACVMFEQLGVRRFG